MGDCVVNRGSRDGDGMALAAVLLLMASIMADMLESIQRAMVSNDDDEAADLSETYYV
jgi:hypothetical protein